MKIKIFLKLLLQLLILISINQISYFIVDLLHLPIPGNVMGMLLLFVLLWSGIIKLKWIEEISTYLIKHLSFFFIPISVGLMTLGSVFMKSGLSILLVLGISTVIGIIFSGISSQVLIKRRERTQQSEHHHSA